MPQSGQRNSSSAGFSCKYPEAASFGIPAPGLSLAIMAFVETGLGASGQCLGFPGRMLHTLSCGWRHWVPLLTVSEGWGVSLGRPSGAEEERAAPARLWPPRTLTKEPAGRCPQTQGFLLGGDQAVSERVSHWGHPRDGGRPPVPRVSPTNLIHGLGSHSGFSIETTWKYKCTKQLLRV